jgi:hypothetical protein
VPATAGVSGPAFYVNRQLYRTVGTPTDLSGTGAPAWGVLDSVAEVAATLAAGSATDRGVVRQFECPAIPLPQS